MDPTTATPPEAAPAPAGNTVLVVDDSAMDRHLAGAIVQKMAGWSATFAGNGIEALASLEKQKPDIVLTDMLMPEMDGLQLVQAIRSKYPLVPVILMTAHGSEDIGVFLWDVVWNLLLDLLELARPPWILDHCEVRVLGIVSIGPNSEYGAIAYCPTLDLLAQATHSPHHRNDDSD